MKGFSIMVEKPLNIAIAGLGTVGGAVFDVLTRQADHIAARCGRSLKVVAVSARSHHKDRPAMGEVAWCEDAVAMAARPDVDIVVELIGGSEGVARQVCETALKSGKALVTANKALLARQGLGLVRLVEDSNLAFGFEAAVCSGIPVVKTLREALAGNVMTEVRGILNGTCNYILSRMQYGLVDLETALAEAKERGYTEADPSFDLDGLDAAHKLALLSTLAFGVAVDMDNMIIRGIGQIAPLDMSFAEKRGYAIKLLGISRMTEHGLEQFVTPCMVPRNSVLACIHGVRNAVQIHGDCAGELILTGQGAGAEATSSSIIADLIDIANGRRTVPFGVPTAKLRHVHDAPLKKIEGNYYVRLCVTDGDSAGDMIQSIFSDYRILTEIAAAHVNHHGGATQLKLTTGPTNEAALQKALDDINALPSVIEQPCPIRIEPAEI